MQLSLIIVNYNTTEHLVNCLESIIKLTKDIEYEILVVDNNSEEREIELLSGRFSDVKFYFLKTNNGFGAASNFGASKSNSEFFAFINPDVMLIDDIFKPICCEFSKLPQMGVCAPMLLSPNGSYQNSTGFKMGPLFEFLEAFWLIGFYRKLRNAGFKNGIKIAKLVEVGWVSGALLVIRKDIFEKVNGFDEDFFLNYEDIDLCRRVEKVGFKNYCYPDLKCIHVGLVSQEKNFESLVLNRYKSRLIYSKKQYTPIVRIGVRWMHIAGLFIRIVVLYFKQKNNENKQRLSGYKKSLKIYLGRVFN